MQSRLSALLLFGLIPAFLYSQEISGDSIHNLNTVVVTGKKNDFLSLQNIGTKLDMRLMNMLPNILGNADPFHYLQFLPGIQTNNEYDAGLYIQGSENGHNMVAVDGVPIYNSGHLLGIFSTFNSAHYNSLLLYTHPHSSAFPNRIGGHTVMQLYNRLPDKPHGQLSVGPVSSQGSVKIPLSKKSGLILSGRLSYLNLLYSQWLDIDGSKIKYDFSDFNVTYIHNINKKNTLWVDGYYGQDNVIIDDRNYGINLSLKWGNKMLAAHLKTDISELIHLRQKIFFTNFENNLILKSDYLGISIPSGIMTYGYSANMDYKRLTMGIDASYHNIELQSPAVSNYYQDTFIDSKQHSEEVSAYLEYQLPLRAFLLELGVRGSLFHCNGDKTYLSADPSLSITYKNSHNWSVCLTGYQRHQYLTQTGVSSIGLPIEFWLSSTESVPPQVTRGLNLSWRKFFGNKYSLTLEGFYKKLYHQIEYVGNLLDLKDRNYSLDKYIYSSKGENYGMSIILTKRTGKIVGWMNYTYTHARRSAEGSLLGSWYSPSHERPQEFNLLMTYKINKRWSLGSTFVFASGTPFTASSSFYVNNGNIISQYGKYNDNRLPGYTRLDLSVGYSLKTTGRSMSGINFSLYNALNSGNPLLYRLKLYDNEYGYKKLSFVMRMMPSVSFFYKF